MTVGRDADRAGGDARVAQVHRQARITLAMSVGFVIAAPIAAVVPHDTGPWLPLHLFVVGGLLGAISGATQMLGVTWSASPAPPAALASAQRTVLGLGTVAIALGREADSRAIVEAGGALVLGALVLLAVALIGIRAGAKVRRFRPALDAYLVAITLGLAGTTLGVLLAVGRAGEHPDRVLATHASTNLLGLVGLVIAATVPWFAATQARTKMSRRATERAVRVLTGVLAGATVVTLAGFALGIAGIAGAGLTIYALGVAAVYAFVPPLGRRQLEWAGPRLLQLLVGMAWWAACVGLLAAAAFRSEPMGLRAIEALVVGGYAQILAGSLAYLAPVLRGGGHLRLGQGFDLTRSWIGLAAGNVGAVAALAGATEVLIGAILVWIADVAVRAVRLRVGGAPPSIEPTAS